MLTRREALRNGMGLAAILAAGKAPAYLLGARGVAFGRRYTAKDYVQNGLYAHWDAIENGGYGIHTYSLNIWKDLKGGVGDLSLYGSTMNDDEVSFTNGGANYKDISGLPVTIQFKISGFSLTDRCCIRFGTGTSWGSLNGSYLCPYFNSLNIESPFAWQYYYGQTLEIEDYYKLDKLITVIHNGQNISFYVDGSLSASFVKSESFTYSKMSLGGYRGGSNMKVREILFYRKVLSLEEITNNSNVSKARFGFP